nr:MAG TPA: hypothetical protein [Bacteriophage sp.]
MLLNQKREFSVSPSFILLRFQAGAVLCDLY